MLPQAKLETFSATREKLRAGGIDLVSWYCGHLSKRFEIASLAEGVRVFGIKTVSGSAEREMLDEIEGACSKYGIAFCIHNHYFANRQFTYESPEDVLSAVKGRANVFATLDTGHMIAVGVDPTQAYRKLKAYVRIIHLKDEDTPGHGVVMGKGSGNMAQFLRTILSDGFQGLGAIEFEEGKDPVQEVAECVKFIRNRLQSEAS
jgi:sugar phosphate isomerase/epimerase